MIREAAAVLEAARAAGVLEAEVFSKSGRGRTVVLEPGLRPGAPPRRTVSILEEEGTALRIIDREGRKGFAWIGLPASARTGASLLDAAFLSARHEPACDGQERRPLGPGPRKPEEGRDLRLTDPARMDLPPERIASYLHDAADSAGSGSAASIDRLALSEWVTTVTLANSRGFIGSYTKGLYFLSVALVPEEPGAAAVVEERSASRLKDIDARDCVRQALRRAGPARGPAEALPSGPVPLLLTPRAAASLVAALLPWVIAGDPSIWKGSALRIVDDPTLPGRPGSAPFDGAGYETRRTVLVKDGRIVGRLSEVGGNLQRPSYRDLPEIGPAGIRILPADARDPDDGGGREAADDRVVLRVSALDVVTGPHWVLRVRRGDYCSDGKALRAADGICWEGPLTALLHGISPIGTGTKPYHCGAPIETPALRLDGLAPLRVEAPGRTAVTR